MRRALESFGYDVRKIIPATMSAIPADCAAVLDVNPRATYLPGESDLLLDYLARGGAAILMYDLGFVLEPRLTAGLRKVGVVVEQDVVIDPLDHYSTDPEVVAVPVYERHPITRSVALTFFPGIRSLTLLPPPPGVTSGPLFLSSPQSYTRAVPTVAERQPGRDNAAAPPATAPGGPGRRILAAALEGAWPGAGPGPSRFGWWWSATEISPATPFCRTWPTATSLSRWCAGRCARNTRPRSPCGCRCRGWSS